MTFLNEKHKINGVIIMMGAMIARDFKFERVIAGAGRTFLSHVQTTVFFERYV